MGNLKEIRTRISSVSSTRQITSAMKLVAAAKLRKAQDAILQMRPYANKLHEILVSLSSSIDMDETENVYADQRKERKILFVVISSNRGLCGGFNANIVKSVIQAAKEEYPDLYKKDAIDYWMIGKKAQDILKAKDFPKGEAFHDLFDHLNFENAGKLAEELMQSFIEKKYDKIILFYNQFKNPAVQFVTKEQFLPVKIEKEESGSIKKVDYIFEPDKEYMVKVLIPGSLKIQFYKALLDSNASEQGARMTAMHKATDNADELIKELKLNYNKARQSTITNEILEIVSGAEALKS